VVWPKAALEVRMVFDRKSKKFTLSVTVGAVPGAYGVYHKWLSS